MIHIEQNNPKKPISVIYFDGYKKSYYVKRFLVENTMSRFSFITDHKDSHLEVISTDYKPQIEIIYVKERGKERKNEIVNISEFIAIKGEKALGNKLTSRNVKEINLIESLPYEEVFTNEINEEETKDKDNLVSTKTDIELEITNKIDDPENINSSKDSDDDQSNGQITLEL